VFNQDLLSKWVNPGYKNQKKPHPPPPEIIGGEEEHQVSAILDKRKFRGQTQYRIRWEGYGAEEDTWEPIMNLQGSKQLIEQFEQELAHQTRENRRPRGRDL
jgi:hypothetical protein